MDRQTDEVMAFLVQTKKDVGHGIHPIIIYSTITQSGKIWINPERFLSVLKFYRSFCPHFVYDTLNITTLALNQILSFVKNYQALEMQRS